MLNLLPKPNTMVHFTTKRSKNQICVRSTSELQCFLHQLNKTKLFVFPHLSFHFLLVQFLWCFLHFHSPYLQVRQLQESAAQLRTVYAGEKAEAIACREHEVMQCWKDLLTSCEDCRVQITTETDKLRFFAMVRDQLMWMDSIICQIGTGEKPR